jgi:hypothetical protein
MVDAVEWRWFYGTAACVASKNAADSGQLSAVSKPHLPFPIAHFYLQSR